MYPRSDMGAAAMHDQLIRTAESAPDLENYGTLRYASAAGDQVDVWRSTTTADRLVVKITTRAGECWFFRTDNLEQALQTACEGLGLPQWEARRGTSADPAPPSAA